MSLNAHQFEALFTNAFGSGTDTFDIQIDASGDVAIGRKGDHTIELFVVQQRPIEWRVDGAALMPWKHHAKDDKKRFENADALHLKLA